MAYLLGPGIDKKVEYTPLPAEEEQFESLGDQKIERNVRWRMKCQKFFFIGVHVFFCLFVLACGIFCSIRRKQAISFYFTICFTFMWLVLDSVWRVIHACWHHRAIKISWWLVWLQVGALLTQSALCWYCIQKA